MAAFSDEGSLNLLSRTGPSKLATNESIKTATNNTNHITGNSCVLPKYVSISTSQSSSSISRGFVPKSSLCCYPETFKFTGAVEVAPEKSCCDEAILVLKPNVIIRVGSVPREQARSDFADDQHADNFKGLVAIQDTTELDNLGMLPMASIVDDSMNDDANDVSK